jgi:hypothetical protein
LREEFVVTLLRNAKARQIRAGGVHETLLAIAHNYMDQLGFHGRGLPLSLPVSVIGA